MSSGSLSSDLGDTWHHGPPIRPRWAGGLELGSDAHNENTEEDVREDWSYAELDRGVGGAARDFISEVRESSLWFCLTHSATASLRPMC